MKPLERLAMRCRGSVSIRFYPGIENQWELKADPDFSGEPEMIEGPVLEDIAISMHSHLDLLGVPS